MELIQKSVPDIVWWHSALHWFSVCSSVLQGLETWKRPFEISLTAGFWFVSFNGWILNGIKIQGGGKRPDSGGDFSCFNTNAPATLVELPPVPMGHVFLEHQGTENFLVTQGTVDLGVPAMVVVAYCSYCPWVIPPSSFCSVCPCNTLVMSYFKR